MPYKYRTWKSNCILIYFQKTPQLHFALLVSVPATAEQRVLTLRKRDSVVFAKVASLATERTVSVKVRRKTVQLSAG